MYRNIENRTDGWYGRTEPAPISLHGRPGHLLKFSARKMQHLKGCTQVVSVLCLVCDWRTSGRLKFNHAKGVNGLGLEQRDAGTGSNAAA